MVLITSSISTSALALGLALEWGASGFVPDTGFLAGLERVVDHLGNCLEWQYPVQFLSFGL